MLAPLSSASPGRPPLTRLDCQGLNGERDILGNRCQEAPLIPTDRVACHAQPRGEFTLGETEEEPLLAKLPTGQLAPCYLGEHYASMLWWLRVGSTRRGSKSFVPHRRTALIWLSREQKKGGTPKRSPDTP